MTKKIIVSGAYGVGKSEFCVQWAYKNRPCTIADFDILNPYFRPRELQKKLEEASIHVIASHLKSGLNQDLPAMSFAFQKALLSDEHIIIDCAGSENGLKPLQSLDENFDKAEFWLVLNLNRIESSLEKMDEMIELYETTTKRKITGFIHNTHVLDETSAEMIIQAQSEVETYAKLKNIPIEYTMINKDFIDQCIDRIKNPLLILDNNYLRKEWMKGETL